MRLPSKEEVRRVRERFPAGCRVELISMGPDPYSKLKKGDRGTVSSVDDIGTVFVNWDCGSGLGMVYDEDEIRRLEVKTSSMMGETRFQHGSSKERPVT